MTECVKSVSCGAHCTAAIAEPRDNDATVSTRRLWVWGQNQVIYLLFYAWLMFQFWYIYTVVCPSIFSNIKNPIFAGIKLPASILGSIHSRYGNNPSYLQVFNLFFYFVRRLVSVDYLVELDNLIVHQPFIYLEVSLFVPISGKDDKKNSVPYMFQESSCLCLVLLI